MHPNPSSLILKLSSLPTKPGVYMFKDKNGGIIYIGKAKNLRARVKQYFRGEDERPQIPYLMKEVANFDYTVVSTELESLYFERTLIQKHRPKYNIELKDDKAYAFIVIDYSTEIPQVVVSRKNQESRMNSKSGSQDPHTTRSAYFGPYTSAKKIRNLIFTARKTFGLCSALKIGKPCFYFHLHRCPGVCVKKITLNAYKKHLKKINLFFKGKTEGLIKNLKTEMSMAANQKRFEKAAKLRDEIRALEMGNTRQNIILTKPVDWDVIGIATDEDTACVNLFKIRAGKMLDKENFIYKNLGDLSGRSNLPDGKLINSEILQTFLENYYTETSDCPNEIYLPSFVSNSIELDTKIIVQLAQNRFRKKITVKSQKRGKAFRLIDLSKTNAMEYLKNYLNEKAGHRDKIQRGLTQLKEILKLPTIPRRIEGYDISNIQGTNAVGSMVVFEDGSPKKSEYRKFKIQGKHTPDDYKMIKEMLSRRLNRIKNQKLGIMDKEKWPIPDLIVIDGGKGQLGVATTLIDDSKFMIPVIGLAKRIEEIFIPNQKQPIVLSPDNPGLQLLQRLRDEAHRFGITFHQHLRSTQAIKSALDDIPGIGSKTKKLLKSTFGTVTEIKQVNFDTLTKVVGKKLAQKLKQIL